MCGIAGIWSRSRVDREVLRRMGLALAHRGPDDEGLWIDDPAGIGLCHRRLAIIDLTAAGRQPMISANGRYVLTFNGEIYNHLELRAEIGCPRTIRWRGNCDTETLLEAISLWGLGPTLQRCVGMFALALWDRHERQLSFARDRFGEKPLYFGYVGKNLVFGSELQAFTAHPGFDCTIDRAALAKLAARGYIPAPHSIFEAICKLEPASFITISAAHLAQRSVPAANRYWSYPALVRRGFDDPIKTEGEALEQLECSLAEAVKTQRVADVPVGLFLSGGIDSSTILALHRAHISGEIRTYSVSFAEQGYDEDPYARAVAAHFGTRHHEFRIDAADALAVIPRLGTIYGEPFADPSGIPTFLISRLARDDVTVALTGDGGDELFGGYTRYRTAASLRRVLRRLPPGLRKAAGGMLQTLPSAMTGRSLQRTFRRVATGDDLREIYRSFRDEWTGEASPVLGAAEGAGTDDLDLNDEILPDIVRMMSCDATSYLPGDVLCKVDRASMASSLEAHAPFLDHRVAEVAARIGQPLMVGRDSGKLTLHKLLNRHAPAALFDRPKAGFTVPVGEWLGGPLRELAEELLSPERLAQEGYFDPGPIRRLWQHHLHRRCDGSMALWAILMFQAWMNAFVDGCPVAKPAWVAA